MNEEDWEHDESMRLIELQNTSALISVNVRNDPSLGGQIPIALYKTSIPFASSPSLEIRGFALPKKLFHLTILTHSRSVVVA